MSTFHQYEWRQSSFSLLPEDIVQNSNIMCKDKPLALGFII